MDVGEEGGMGKEGGMEKEGGVGAVIAWTPTLTLVLARYYIITC